MKPAAYTQSIREMLKRNFSLTSLEESLLVVDILVNYVTVRAEADMIGNLDITIVDLNEDAIRKSTINKLLKPEFIIELSNCKH
ncbi:MAG: hypothetical protein DRJ68_01355 [Thermoprotei archaeon]|nr:MAG: hypothetical protein DRJ62_05550 [Thermoprotei archaeon]RLF22546.1 MAG: hypothetical protein DRJ68_01355 [Thermoprotei archaeon]